MKYFKINSYDQTFDKYTGKFESKFNDVAPKINLNHYGRKFKLISNRNKRHFKEWQYWNL